MTMMTPARTAVAAALVGMLLVLSGCGRQVPGADGNLIDDWRAMAAPTFDLPGVGACMDGPAKFARASAIACDRGHTLEVVLVGTVEGDAAQAPEPPAAGSEAFQAAYTAC